MNYRFEFGVKHVRNSTKTLQLIVVFLFLMGCYLSFAAPHCYAEAGPGSGSPGITSGDDGNGNLSDEIDKVNPGADSTPAKKTEVKKDSPKAPAKVTAAPAAKTPPAAAPKTQAPKAAPSIPLVPAETKYSPKPSAPASPVILEKKEGALRNYSLKLKDQNLTFSQFPLACIDGKIFISASDPDFKRLFESMGLTYSWFSYSGKLFIYLPQGSITWNVKEDTAMVGDKKVQVPDKARAFYGDDYIPLESLTRLLDMRVVENGAAFEIKPGIRVTAGKSADENTIDIFLSAATEIQYEVKYQANPPAVRFTIPMAAYNEISKKLFVEGVQVRINDATDPDKLFVTMEFPHHWKGKIIPTSHKNQIVVRMKPNVVYAWDSKDETLNSVEVTKLDDKIHMLFNTSGYVQYYWACDPEEGVLYVDIPFATPASGLSLKNVTNSQVRNCQVSTYSPDGVNITRIRLEINPQAAFMIGPPEDQEGNCFALLIGLRNSISEPSPRMGGSEVGIAAGSRGQLIVIDPGHGGSDPGARNHELGISEKDLNLDMARKLASLLSRKGWKIFLTRNTDTDLTYPGSPDCDELQARCDVANKRKASLFVSIHCNASVSKALRGSSYHYSKGIDRPVARALEGSLGENIGTVDKGIHHDSFYVLTHTTAPSVLVETAFVSNSQDIRILADDSYRQRIAIQLAKSIDIFLRSSGLARRPAPAGGADE